MDLQDTLFWLFPNCIHSILQKRGPGEQQLSESNPVDTIITGTKTI